MYPSLATSFTVLAMLVAPSLAAPVAAPGIKIPLSKRFVNRDETSGGAADMNWVLSTTEHTINKYHATLTAFEQNLGHALEGMSSTADRELMKATRLAKRQSAGEPLIDEQSGSYWQGSISIGTPGQNFNMDFDTGSSDLWVPAPSAGTGGNTYNPSDSSTSQDQGRTFTISYGDGSQTSGEVYTDDVTIAGLTATNQGVGYATSVSSTSGSSFDGLVGMAYQSLSTEQESPYFATLYTEGVVNQGQFAFALTSSGAELYLGGVDSSKYTGSITYTPVTQQAFWQVGLDAVTVNGQTVVSGSSAIIDTGTTLMYAPTSDASNFYNAYPGAQPMQNFNGYSSSQYAGYYAVPCSGGDYVSLTFGGVSYTIPNSQFTNQGYVGNSNGQNYCMGALIGSDSMGTGNSWLVGDTFISSVYAVFDLANNQVGFANPTY